LAVEVQFTHQALGLRVPFIGERPQQAEGGLIVPFCQRLLDRVRKLLLLRGLLSRREHRGQEGGYNNTHAPILAKTHVGQVGNLQRVVNPLGQSASQAGAGCHPAPLCQIGRPRVVECTCTDSGQGPTPT